MTNNQKGEDMTKTQLAPLQAMALSYGMTAEEVKETIKNTVVPGNITDAEFTTFIMVAHQYALNPFVKEIYAFPKKGGGLQPIVSIDGWLKLINSHQELNGLETREIIDGGKVTAVEAKIYRKDRSHPVVVTEYMEECKRQTEPWQKWPVRMLRHKAIIQCARYAFGFAGIMEPDEAERMTDVQSGQVSGAASKLQAAVDAKKNAQAEEKIIEAEIIEVEAEQPVDLATPDQLDELEYLFEEKKISSEKKIEWLQRADVRSFSAFEKDKMDKLLTHIKKIKIEE